MIVYRRHAAEDSLDLGWHFHTQCPRWPESEYVQERFLKPSASERLCEECVNIEFNAWKIVDNQL